MSTNLTKYIYTHTLKCLKRLHEAAIFKSLKIHSNCKDLSIRSKSQPLKIQISFSCYKGEETYLEE